mmetsp:Transcript_178512/g.572055  ORF Transcript_178512/g.572055 Transcript_178512/m.572055 type:complete len:1068 (+) Transcript_178512:55-3258(+)
MVHMLAVPPSEPIDVDAFEGPSPKLQPQAPQQEKQQFYAAAAPPRRWGRLGSGTNASSGGTVTAAAAAAAGGSSAAGDATQGSTVPAGGIRQLMGSGAGWQVLQGDDALQPNAKLQEAEDAWRQSVRSCTSSSSCGGGSFEDADFPAEARSLFGQDRGKAKQPSEDPGSPPRCGCGAAAKRSNVQKEGPNTGRPYWTCETRRCRFFAWADAEARRNANMTWRRFPEFVVVHDFGFRAEDLRQGGVGDCWFLSALAVVAERPDLIIRLFGGETSKNAAGCYQLRLFLDGEWQAITVDDRLPCTDNQRRPDGSGLAYSRADGQQLWTPLLEKAYAKAHGSYKAISGGEIAEALLDLTGFPTESIDFGEDGFDTQELWRRMVKFKEKGFPMGCATAGNPELKEVGLCGNHAYSILDVRELYDPRFLGRPLGYGGSHEDGWVRLLRIRNPHGVGEWTGEWSDRGSEWTLGLAAQLGRTGVDDGTFWMDFTHFLMAFQVVDVCMAHRGWHARSFENAFCAKASGSRLCKYMYELRCDDVTTIYAMALQPTKRGAWCRDDRKKSYKPGDVSMLLLRLGPDRSCEAVVGGNFFCADIMARRSVQATLDQPQATYLLVALCFGNGPIAHGGEVRGSAPFRIRLFSSRPVAVRQVESEHQSRLAGVAVTGVHAACLTLAPAPGRRFKRLVRRLGSDILLFQISGEGAIILLVANLRQEGVEAACLALKADVKVMTARAGEGLLLASDASAEKQPVTCFTCGRPGHLAVDCPVKPVRGVRPPWRYPAKWRRVATVCRVPAGMQRVAMVLIGNGMQTELDSIQAELAPADVGVEASQKGGALRWSLSSPAALFEPRPLMRDLVESAAKASATSTSGRFGSGGDGGGDPDRAFDEVMDSVRQASLALLKEQEEAMLQAALAASSTPASSSSGDTIARLAAGFDIDDDDDEAAQLAAAMQLSLGGAAPQVIANVGASRGGDDMLSAALAESAQEAARSADDDLQAALLLSAAPWTQTRSLARQMSEVLIDSDSDEGLVEVATGASSMSPAAPPDAKRPKVAEAKQEFYSAPPDAWLPRGP